MLDGSESLLLDVLLKMMEMMPPPVAASCCCSPPDVLHGAIVSKFFFEVSPLTAIEARDD